MYCPKCGTENKEEDRFCKKCGTVLETVETVEVKIKFCSSCGAELVEGVTFCGFCGTRISGLGMEREVEPIPRKTIGQIEHSKASQFSFKQPIRNLVLLYVCTLGFYWIYWFYRNWKHMKIHKNLDISPGLRTIGLFVPIYSLIIVYEQFKDIGDSAKEAGCGAYPSPGWLFAGFWVFSALSMFIWMLPDPYSLLGWIPDLLRLGVLIFVQNTINCYWEKEQIGLPERTEFSGIEVAVLIIGGIIVVMSFIGAFIPV